MQAPYHHNAKRFVTSISLKPLSPLLSQSALNHRFNKRRLLQPPILCLLYSNSITAHYNSPVALRRSKLFRFAISFALVLISFNLSPTAEADFNITNRNLLPPAFSRVSVLRIHSYDPQIFMCTTKSEQHT
ncbi:hypothetical protein CC78DRAFT_316708 [Lojkania enalia]|uniref:Uncharacterized protein n=1 Tax=Lojkania enalia TaxID=147567 RepID=A0A9P4KAP9_9PLEO|nr:hypothetical protein CC78DRAFT_316708 [Didymosphaeria enalia]